jgi:threonine/homoserine/homoserine lactone efflux protein
MGPRVAGGVVAIVSGIVIVTHHIGYFRHSRPLTFGAFLQTGGWIIIALVAAAAAAGGLDRARTQTVEVAQVLVGMLLIGLGGKLK